MRLLPFLILALLSTPLAAKGREREVNLHKQCYGNRCVYYDKFGNRVAVVTRDSTGRTHVENSNKTVRVIIRDRDENDDED